MEKKFTAHLFNQHQMCVKCPPTQKVVHVFGELMGTLFPGFNAHEFDSQNELDQAFVSVKKEFQALLAGNSNNETEATQSFFNEIPTIYDLLIKDVDAMYEGDPAATSHAEVIRSYPGFLAIAAYRFAHSLLKLEVENIPRMMTEYAHGMTGIDIHPGASIGQHFCIDHGTGVVIGETTVIGDHVKIYQGVTLGALSVSKSKAKTKRHPTIEDGVVIYAGATILGGKTTIGQNSTIGGNVWLTKSIPPDSRVYYQARMHQENGQEPDLIIVK